MSNWWGTVDTLLMGTGDIRMTSPQDFSYSLTPTHGELIDFFKATDQKRQNPYDGTARLRLRARQVV
jgi:hypothetical protein